MSAESSDDLSETLPAPTLSTLSGVIARLQSDIDAARDAEAARVAMVDPCHAAGAVNLMDYVVMRQHDLRPIQGALAGLGLSSLGRAEADVSQTLRRVGRALAALAHDGTDVEPARPAGESLDRNSDDLFGGPPLDRRVRIMVTASAELLDDPLAIQRLVEAGMDVLRINCAHDTAAVWRLLAESTRAATAITGRDCRILMDIGGPKLRTGAIRPGHRVVSWHPQRDEFGGVPEPVRLWFGEGPPPCPVDVAVPLADGGRLDRVRVGDVLRLRDARGRGRDLPVLAVTAEGVVCTSDRSAWVEPGTALRRLRKGRLSSEVASVGLVDPLPGYLLLAVGDEVWVTRDPRPGRAGAGGRPATVPCTLPEVFPAVKPGHPILFDDGKIEGVVESADEGTLRVRIIRAKPGGSKLRSDKGINLPTTHLPVGPLTAYDLQCLDVVAELADMVGLSFVREPEDVRMLADELAARGADGVGIVLKVETQSGFQNLPSILLEAMRRPRVGVMIARGDLAVECGFERLAELQEEILWVCEAAHVPTIWATQVLDTMARTGVATRAEITDAASGQRAECVMLNKGAHALDATRALADILCRMGAHQRKKTAMLRPLRSLKPSHGG